MHAVAALALSAIAIAAAASNAFAEDRGAKLDASLQANGEIQTSDVAFAARAGDVQVPSADARALSANACRGAAPTATATVSSECQSSRPNGYRLIRSVDWSAVGPSVDDFAPTEDSLRLVGARLVATYRF